MELTDKQKRRIELTIECIHCKKSKGCPLKQYKKDNCVNFEEKEGYRNGRC